MISNLAMKLVSGFLIILAAMVLMKLLGIIGVLIVVAAIIYGWSTIDVSKPPWYKR